MFRGWSQLPRSPLRVLNAEGLVKELVRPRYRGKLLRLSGLFGRLGPLPLDILNALRYNGVLHVAVIRALNVKLSVKVGRVSPFGPVYSLPTTGNCLYHLTGTLLVLKVLGGLSGF